MKNEAEDPDVDIYGQTDSREEEPNDEGIDEGDEEGIDEDPP